MQFAVWLWANRRTLSSRTKHNTEIDGGRKNDGRKHKSSGWTRASGSSWCGIFVKLDPDFHFLSRSFSISYANQWKTHNKSFRMLFAYNYPFVCMPFACTWRLSLGLCHASYDLPFCRWYEIVKFVFPSVFFSLDNFSMVVTCSGMAAWDCIILERRWFWRNMFPSVFRSSMLIYALLIFNRNYRLNRKATLKVWNALIFRYYIPLFIPMSLTQTHAKLSKHLRVCWPLISSMCDNKTICSCLSRAQN